MLDNTQTGDTTGGSTVSVPFTLYCPHIERCRAAAASQTFLWRQYYNIPNLSCTCCTSGCPGSRWCWGGTSGPSRSRTQSHSTAGCCPSTPENCNIANIGAILAVFTFGCCLNIWPSMSRSPALDSRLIILQTDTNTRLDTGVSGPLFYWWQVI